MATNKRIIHQDPEYDAIPAEIQEKRIKLNEDNVRNQTKKKIENIVKSNFEQEITKKDEEVDSIDELLHEGRCVLDRLRACVIAKYYATLGQEPVSNDRTSSSVHPAVKKYHNSQKNNSFSENLVSNQDSAQTTENGTDSRDFQFNNRIQNNQVSERIWSSQPSTSSQSDDLFSRAPRLKKKCMIVVGNISKFLPKWQRSESDPSTHKWMVYVRGDKYNPSVESFVKKVCFLLHPSYRPSDIVEISNPPFHLIKKGWGEFPVRVQIHFHDPRNKSVDIIHNLKLDKTYTGLQTLGAETVVELQVFKPDSQVSSCNSPFTSDSSLTSKSDKSVSLNSNGPIPEGITIVNSTPIVNVDTITKQTEDSLVMNVKFLKSVLNDAKSNQTSVVNTPKDSICSDSPVLNSITDSNSQIKTLPKIVITDNQVKPVALSNGLKSAFLKCKDGKQLLLVPPPSIVFKAPPNSTKPSNIPQANTDVKNSTPTTVNNNNKTVPSFILKVVPNQNSGKNQLFIIPMEKKTKPIVQKSVDIETESPVESEVKENTSVSNVDKVIKKSPHLHYEEELEMINLDYCKSFVELLKRVCKIFPLVKKNNVDCSTFIFCANSLEDFQSWNIGKQRACEWRRAAMVRKAILNLLEKKEHPIIKPESVWSQSSIMSWCRKNGFVPMATEKLTLLPEPKWSGVELCSLANADDLVSSLKEESNNLVSTDEEEINIIDICDTEEPKASANQSKKDVCHLPHLSESALFVKQAASQLGIDIKPVEVEPQLFVPVIEEIILAACREFASDLIGSSLYEGYDRLGGKMCPEEITVSDVYSAIKKNPQWDFVSNNFLGIPKDTEGNT